VNVRIIPRLDIKGPNLVKGVHLEGLRVLGKPEQFARAYYEQGADELLFIDVVASLYGRNSLTEIIERTARELFVPLTVGGGLRTLDDIRAALRAGADKVSLNTAAIQRPHLVREASRRFGSSTIVVSIEAIRLSSSGRYEAFTHNGRERTGRDAIEWATEACELGAGELLITSIDREGTGSGFDLELTRAIADAVPIPVIASGGAGTSEHVAAAYREGHASAAAIASLLHYATLRSGNGPETHASAGAFAPEINLAHLRTPGFARIQDISLPQLKSHLAQIGLETRPPAPVFHHG
jgi:cyclase